MVSMDGNRESNTSSETTEANFKNMVIQSSLSIPLNINVMMRKNLQKMFLKNSKTARKAEVNYLPPYPPREIEDSLEHGWLELLGEAKKMDNGRVIYDMMSGTCSCRKPEIVLYVKSVADLKER